MSFHKITYHAGRRFATLHHYGCNFRCPVCSYKLRSGEHGEPGRSHPRPAQFLSIDAMKTALRSVPVERVFFMGGEPTLARELPEMLAFAKNELGAGTFLGHTNGNRLPLANLDGANVGLKAWDEAVHERWTGRPKKLIFENFAASVHAGLSMKANIVFVPGVVDIDQIEAVAEWLGSLNREIPFRVMGYIPVPGQSYARPTSEQMEAAVAACRGHLSTVEFSHLTSEAALDLAVRDERFAVRRLAGEGAIPIGTAVDS